MYGAVLQKIDKMAHKQHSIGATRVKQECTFAYRTGDIWYPFGWTHFIQRMYGTILFDIVHIHQDGAAVQCMQK
jgi:hypothetical protein